MKPNKAILIDVFNRTITEIVVNGLGDLQKAVGGYIETATRDSGNEVFVYEEGLFEPHTCWFVWEGAQPFKGNGIVIGGNDRTGESCDCSFTVEEVKNKVKFVTESEIMLYFP